MVQAQYWLKFTLKSDATFGRGEGIAGLVDSEVEHTEDDGLPYLRGRALKDLLFEECKNILFAIKLQEQNMDAWQKSSEHLFGRPGSTSDDEAVVRFDNAQLPADLRQSVHEALSNSKNQLTRTDILESVTWIRRQTAIDEQTGAPFQGSLRAMRVIRSGLPFEALLSFLAPPEEGDLALLCACILAFRRAGTARNRGRGRLQAFLYDARGQDQTKFYFDVFTKLVREGAKK